MEGMPRQTHLNWSRQNVIKYLMSLLTYKENFMNFEVESSVWSLVFELWIL